MRVGIWHRGRAKMDGERVRTHPAGGTEAAVVHTAEALAGLGPSVDVWANCDADLYYEGVRYRPNANAAAALEREEYDAFVVVRHLVGATVPVRARAVLYWTHDSLDQPFVHGAVRFRDEGVDEVRCVLSLGDLLGAGLVDHVFAVSHWQAKDQARHFGVDAARFHVVGNGLSIAAQKRLGVREHKRPFVLHTLPPDRALPELLAIFPRVKQRVPRAELHAYSRSTIYGATEEEDLRQFGGLYEALRLTPGVKHFDPIDALSLASVLRRASVWAYPTTVRETYSISTLEAQAAGCVPVVSAVGALPERIEHGVDGILVPGDPAEEAVQREFVDYVTRLLVDRDYHAQLAGAARERALAPSAGYGAVAARMLHVLEETLDGKDVERRGLDLAELEFPLLAATPDRTPRREVPRDELERLLREMGENLGL